MRTHAPVSYTATAATGGTVAVDGGLGMAVEDDSQGAGRLEDGVGLADGLADGVGMDSVPVTARPSVDVEREDKARFARLRELTRRMSTKVKGGLGRHKAGEETGKR